MTDIKDKGIEISISTIGTLIPVVAVLWFILQPMMLRDLSVAMADDLKEQMEDHAAPMESAFKVLLLSDINSTKKSIAALEFSRSADPDAWTSVRAQLLVDNEIALLALQEAYRLL